MTLTDLEKFFDWLSDDHGSDEVGDLPSVAELIEEWRTERPIDAREAGFT